MIIVDGQCSRPVLTFDLRNNEFAMIRTQDSRSLTDTRRTNVLLNGCAGIGHLHLRKFLSRKEHNFLVVLIFQHRTELLILFHINRTILMRTGQDASIGKGLINLVVDRLVILRMVCQSEAHGSHHRHEMKFEHTIRRMTTKGCHHDEQAVFIGICLADIIDDGHVIRLRGFQIISTFVASLQKQGRRLTIHESEDTILHIVDIACYRPVKPRLKHIQLP